MRALTLVLVVLALWIAPVRAQLARSYYNVTGISVRKLSNAVQILVQTDGNVAFDVETDDLFTITRDFDVVEKRTSQLRLRLNGARIKVPTFTELSAYPVDSAVVTLGNTPLKQSYAQIFGDGEIDPLGTFSATVPRADVLVQFYVPIRLSYSNIRTGSQPGRATLGPRDAEVHLTPDRRAIQITVVTDRVESDRGTALLKRSPANEHHHHLDVSGDATALSVAALHTPLPELLDALSRVSGISLVAQPDALETDVSLQLRGVGLAALLHALERGYGLAAQPRLPEAGGGFLLGKSGGTLVTEQIVLQNLEPTAARLLLPDFLLPLIRPDFANNALVVTAAPEIVARVRADLKRLDQPRQLVRVDVSAYEVSRSLDRSVLVALSRTGSAYTESAAPASGLFSVAVRGESARGVTAQLNQLVAEGKLTLVAHPNLVVASGAKGTLFAGSDRFIAITVNSFGGPRSQALKLPVGTSLVVTPRVGLGGEITLQLQPSFTTVDSVEAKTGLPTLGIRTFDSTLRLVPGDSVLVGNLDADALSTTKNAGSQRESSLKNAVLLVVSATLEKSSKP